MPGDADRRQQRADRRRDQRDEQRDQRRHRHRRAGVLRVRPQRGDDDEEDQRQPGEQDPQRDLVRRLAPRGALDERDHAVEEAPSGLLGDLDHDAVRQHARPAGHRRAVAAGLADHGRRLARDRRLVDGGDALDHGAVTGDHLAGLDDDDVAARELGRGLGAAVAQPRDRLGAHRAQAGGLRPPAPLGERLREVGEHDGQPQPDRDGEREPRRLVPAAERALAAEELDQPRDRRDHARRSRPRTSPGCGPARAGRACAASRRRRAPGWSGPAASATGARRLGAPRAVLFGERSSCGEAVEGEVELEDVDAGLAEHARASGRRCCRRSAPHAGEREAADARDAAAPGSRRWPLEMCGSTPEAELVTASTGTRAAVSPRS